MKQAISIEQKQKVIFLFVNDYDKRLQIIADQVGISMTSVSKIIDQYVENKASFENPTKIEKFIILESKMNYDRD
jgi:hypothetical protein